MPAVIDTLEVVEHEAHDFSTEQPQIHVARSGFWHTMGQYLRRQSVHRLYRTRPASHGLRHPIEMPADILARQYPGLYLQASAGI
jgi:hypothetical protein